MSSIQHPTTERGAVNDGAEDERTESTATAFDTTTTCVECGAQSFGRSDSGEWYCTACGLVHTGTELEFTEPEWTPRDQRRTGPAGSMARLAVGTIVGSTGGTRPTWAAYNTRLTNDQRTLRHGLRELRAVAVALEAPTELTEQAAYLFRRVTERGLLVGHSIEAMAAACIHATARKEGTPFPRKQVAAVSLVDDDNIKSAYSKLVRAFELEVAPPTPAAFIPRFASDAGLSAEVRRRAHGIATALLEAGTAVGQSPTGVAAAALYGAAREAGVPITQEELASIAYVSIVTLSRQWQSVKQHVDTESA